MDRTSDFGSDGEGSSPSGGTIQIGLTKLNLKNNYETFISIFINHISIRFLY